MKITLIAIKEKELTEAQCWELIRLGKEHPTLREYWYKVFLEFRERLKSVLIDELPYQVVTNGYSNFKEVRTAKRILTLEDCKKLITLG